MIVYQKNRWFPKLRSNFGDRILLLFSGGLDSILSAKILIKQRIKVFPVCLKSYFFSCDVAKKSAKRLGLKLKIIDFSKEHLKIIKSPEYGYGKGMNPCVDCHLLMLKKAKKIMKKEKFNFIATGEVLGERAFSQNKRTLIKMEREASLTGLILRPLSAKLLPKTLSEKKGIIKREKLLAIRGKSRKPQMKLVKKFKIKDFPTPAGGCILTDLEYSKKLKELFKKIPNCNGNDCQILRKGRVFWQNNFLIVVGRNEKENKKLKNLSIGKQGGRDIILEPENFAGPTVLVRGFGKKIKRETIKKGTEFLLNFSKKLPETIRIEIQEGDYSL